MRVYAHFQTFACTPVHLLHMHVSDRPFTPVPDVKSHCLSTSPTGHAVDRAPHVVFLMALILWMWDGRDGGWGGISPAGSDSYVTCLAELC